MDEKLCPMRKKVTSWLNHEGTTSSGDFTEDEFLPCVREKCAWWGRWPDRDFDGRFTGSFTEDCAIVGKKT